MPAHSGWRAPWLDGTFVTSTIERQLMVFNGKPFRRDLSQVTWTVMHVEDTLALIALKVMMVRMPS